MSAEKNPYVEQIMRLSALPKFPLYPQGVKELRECLRKHTSTLDRAIAVIDRVIEERENCPTPKELAGIAFSVAQSAEQTPDGCEVCEGQPWITVQQAVFDRYSGRNILQSGSKRCDCIKGQYFRAKDMERKAVSK